MGKIFFFFGGGGAFDNAHLAYIGLNHQRTKLLWKMEPHRSSGCCFHFASYKGKNLPKFCNIVTEILSRIMKKFQFFFLGMYGNFPDEKALFSREDIPDSFIEEIKKSANLFFQLQVKF